MNEKYIKSKKSVKYCLN